MSRDRILSPQVTNIQSPIQSKMNSSTPGTRSMANLSEIWDDLKEGIESIYQQQTMAKARYMILYS